MDCSAAQRLVTPYIKNELSDEELEDFLEHIETCKECREELEIYFTVDYGIRQLDNDTGAYNIKGALENALELSRQRLHSVRLIKITRYAVNTLSAMAVILSLLLQCRIWWQQGIF